MLLRFLDLHAVCEVVFVLCPKVEKLESALRDKDAELARVRQSHTAEVTRLLDELRELRANYELKIREYEELMDIKINLDQEIATYRALLHEEETRWEAVVLLCIVHWGEALWESNLVDCLENSEKSESADINLVVIQP